MDQKPRNVPTVNPIKSILLIEDDLFIGEMYMRSLKKAGYEAELISNGAEGLKAAATNRYDLILLDIMLPEKRGTEILQSLRSTDHDLVPKSRILVLTNFDQDEESRVAMQNKADGYLIKADITPRKLLEIIGSLKAVA
jgi:DNA-binding response OmpR family regulator